MAKEARRAGGEEEEAVEEDFQVARGEERRGEAAPLLFAESV